MFSPNMKASTRRIEKVITSSFVLALAALLVACAGGDAVEPAADAVTERDAGASGLPIVCTVAYRASVTEPIEREETLTFAGDQEEQTLSFADLDFQAAYRPGEADMERSLHVAVTPAGATERLTAQLYQLPLEGGPENQFRGGHGFTGLTYVYHPESGAELQFWCTAGE
ncbi:MAG: hypothetical protein R3272_04495 [Candidatus Promineifilaceae bacterium]|nr:hypothetical protein [Candidatus Promineifilaceae bacterium]